jgi:hypothetical protein
VTSCAGFLRSLLNGTSDGSYEDLSSYSNNCTICHHCTSGHFVKLQARRFGEHPRDKVSANDTAAARPVEASSRLPWDGATREGAKEDMQRRVSLDDFLKLSSQARPSPAFTACSR